MNEERVITFLKQAKPKTVDHILAGEKGLFLLKGMARITYMVIPILYAMCALMGWSFSPAKWSLFVRFMGVSLVVFIYVLFFCFANCLFQNAKTWLEQHGKDAI